MEFVILDFAGNKEVGIGTRLGLFVAQVTATTTFHLRTNLRLARSNKQSIRSASALAAIALTYKHNIARSRTSSLICRTDSENQVIR